MDEIDVTDLWRYDKRQIKGCMVSFMDRRHKKKIFVSFHDGHITMLEKKGENNGNAQG